MGLATQTMGGKLLVVNISRVEALQRFCERYRSPVSVIHAFEETGTNPRYPLTANSWVVQFSLDDSAIIGPSRLLCVSKLNGEIVYDGPAFDEG